MDKALEKLEEQLRCPICLELYTEPKVLKCYHVFCKKCLAKVWGRDKNESSQYAISCPSCRKYTTLDQHNSVACLTPAFHINSLIDLKDIFKKAKEETEEEATKSVLNKISEDEEEMSKDREKDDPSLFCQKHGAREFELYCDTCDIFLCSHCVFRGEDHHSHSYQVIDESYPEHLEQIIASLEPMREKLNITTKELVRADECCREIVARQTMLQDEIKKQMQDLHMALNEREAVLISQLNNISQKKLRGVSMVKDHLLISQSQIQSFLDFMKEKLAGESKTEILRRKASLIWQTKELNRVFDSDVVQLSTQVDMTYTGDPNLIKMCKTFGKVVSLGLPYPEICQTTGMGLFESTVGELQTVMVQVINGKFCPCEEPIDSFKATLTSEFTGRSSEATVSIENQKMGKYLVSFCPEIQGEHKLEITIDNQPVHRSPFTIPVRMRKLYISKPLMTIKNLAGPQGIAVAENGNVYITEYFRHHVLVLNSKGEEIRYFGICGNGNGEMEYPQGLALDGQGNVLVADSDNHRIQKFTPDGSYIDSFGSKGTGPGKFSYPTDITYSIRTNRIYVIDSTCRVHILTSDLTSIGIFGRRGQRDGHFLCPSGISCDSSGRVYITDCSRNNLQVFSADGKFLQSMKKTFNSPNGIAIDNKDSIFVSNGRISCISQFSTEGTLLSVLDLQEKGGGGERRAMAVSKSGLVYICGKENSTEVKVY